MDSISNKCAVCNKDAEYKYEDAIRPAYKCANHLALPASKYTKLVKPVERYTSVVSPDTLTDHHYIAGDCYIFWANHVTRSDGVMVTIHECLKHWVIVTWA